MSMRATLAYLVQAHTPYGFQLFATIGGGIMVFAPTSKGGDRDVGTVAARLYL